jgi:release factor glutamine methyltransferase
MGPPRTTYKDLTFDIFPQVYEPGDDSFLMGENQTVRKGDLVLDMGTGCGIQGIIASRTALRVMACDINPHSVRCARHNVKLNKIDNMEVIKSDLFENVRGRFDTIMFNPPYLISNPADKDDYLKVAWDGGKGGKEVIDRFIQEAKGHLKSRGHVTLIMSSQNISDVSRIQKDIIAEKRFFFERLYLLDVKGIHIKNHAIDRGRSGPISL